MSSINSLLDIMNPPIGLDKQKSILDGIRKILEHKIGRFIIYEADKPIGIVSEKNIISFLFIDKQHRSLDKVPITEIMNDIYYVDKSTSKPSVARFMIDKRCSSVAVGSADNFEGIVTKTDLTKYYAENLSGKNIVVDKMSMHYFSVNAKDSLHEVMKTMLGYGISRILIIDDQKQPVGILSTGDVLRTVVEIEDLKSKTETNNDSEFWEKYEHFIAQPARKVMTPNLIKIDAGEDLAKACQIMIEQKINAVGVDDSSGKLGGIVGKRDVLLALAEMN